MINHQHIDSTELHAFIRQGEITMAGNAKLRIYGGLSCKSGKRMTRKNRVFFKTKQEALDRGFRPCGHCQTNDYKIWKNKQDGTI